MDRLTRIIGWIKIIWKSQETRSEIQTIANVATTIGVIVAAWTFKMSVNDTYERELQTEIRNWQRPAVYSIVRDIGPSTFYEIKEVYEAEAIKAGKSIKASADYEPNRVLL